MLLLCGSEALVQASEMLHTELQSVGVDSELRVISDVGQQWYLEAPDAMATQMTALVKKASISAASRFYG